MLTPERSATSPMRSADEFMIGFYTLELSPESSGNAWSMVRRTRVEDTAFGHFLDSDRRGAVKIKRRFGGAHRRDCRGWRLGVRDGPVPGWWADSSMQNAATCLTLYHKYREHNVAAERTESMKVGQLGEAVGVSVQAI